MESALNNAEHAAPRVKRPLLRLDIAPAIQSHAEAGLKLPEFGANIDEASPRLREPAPHLAETGPILIEPTFKPAEPTQCRFGQFSMHRIGTWPPQPGVLGETWRNRTRLR